EWFTVESEKRYTVHDPTSDSKSIYTGKQLHEGISINLQPGTERRLMVQ
ncbi:unnamed protein product, partial [marine sediment metagenome]